MNRGVRGGVMCGVVQSGAMVSGWRIGWRPQGAHLTPPRVRMQDINLPCSGRAKRRLPGGTLPAAASPAPPGPAGAAHGVYRTAVVMARDGLPRQSVIGELDWMDGTARELVEPLLARAKTA